MAFRSSTLRIARSLTKDLLSASSRRCHSSLFLASRQTLSFAPACNDYYCIGTTTTTTASTTLHPRRHFSGKPEDKVESTEAAADESPAVDETNEPVENNEQTTPPPPSEEETLRLEIATLKENLLRSLAEQENTRRIAQRDIASAKQYAVSSFAKSLLDTSDNLSRALEAVPEELREDRERHPVLANLYEGIHMTYEGLDKAFAKHGLKRYGEVGDVFDPNLHEALFEYADGEKEGGCVGQVMKCGFMLNERVVRPAEVGVVKSG